MIGVKFKSTILLLVVIGNVVATLDTDWWKHTIIYEIYISSFKDSNGDGLGDIKGKYKYNFEFSEHLMIRFSTYYFLPSQVLRHNSTISST